MVVTFPLWLLSCLTPRRKRRWVFIGWHRGNGTEIFADNAKYLFLKTHETEPTLEAIWLAKDENLARTLRERGYLSYSAQSLKGIWYALTAGVTVVDAYLLPENFRWSGRSLLVQLLHGKGMKASGYAKPQLRQHDLIFGPSEEALAMLPASFTKGSQMHVTGYPRDDLFFSPLPGSDISVDVKTAEALRSAKRALLYAPTYRRGAPEFSIEQVLDLSALEPFLKQHDATLFISLHPKYRAQLRSSSGKQIIFVPESDLYPLLEEVDILVTDYSSSFTDFLLLDRPIVFYAPDREAYAASEGLSVDYDTLPGAKAYTPEALIPTLTGVLEKDTWKEARAEARKRYHAFTDGKASERILRIIKESLSL